MWRRSCAAQPVPDASVTASPVAVTGGTGFLGTQLVRRLTSDGFHVRALTRRPRHVLPPPLHHSSVELIRGDITDGGPLERLVRGTAVVYHLAGCATAWARDRGEYHRVNAVGTAAVCRACELQHVPRLVHTSTNLVECGDAPDRLVTAYQRSKLLGERAVFDFHTRGGSPVVVRPTRVYGPGILSGANAVTRIVDLYRRGLFRVRLADRGARGNYAYVEDVVDGIVRAARHGQPGAAYTLGGENATFDEVLATLATVTGRGTLVLALPLAVARGIGRLAEMAARFGIRPPITREWVSLFALDWPSSSEAAERDLDYAPRSLRDGVELTVRWLASGRDPWLTD